MSSTFHFTEERTDISLKERLITGEITINAGVSEVWDAWTTVEGIKSFFAPDCEIEMKVGGKYEILFLNNAEKGKRGSEGCIVLGVQENKMFTFTWSAPPELPVAREQRSFVIIRFNEVDEKHTKINLTHIGWGEGGEWDEAYDYFKKAWLKVVLPRLKYRFDVGPVDWSNPPTFN
jgi:uncharacterized protein YndB with AHSA1/START domain